MSEITIRPLETISEVEECARFMAASEPWVTLGRDYEECRSFLSDETRERYVACHESLLAGFVVLNLKGAFVGYIQTVCVAPGFRGAGVGTKLVEFAEKRIFSEYANVFMCVSSFNASARRLYERLGYTVAGTLTDYIVSGHSEILLRKSRGPISTYGATLERQPSE